MAEVREAGARIRLISDGDVAGAISACRPDSGTDLLAGDRRHPEGIITAAAIRCMGGIQATLAPTDDEERQKAIDRGHDLDRVLTTRDLVSGENVFFCATGVTDGDLLKGVRYFGGGCTPVDRDAFEVRHGPDDRRLPPAVQTQRSTPRWTSPGIPRPRIHFRKRQ